jgi:sigma-B regulation protein RsbU (phosphoserine phosphatase)
MLTGVVKSAFRSAISDTYEPACVAQRVANAIRAFGADRFITLICARLQNGCLEFVNAGHPPGILVSPRNRAVLLEPTGPIISPALVSSWEQCTIPISRGSDRLVLFTDAIIDAESESGEYGLDRLVEEVAGSSLDGRALSHRVLQSVQQFAAGRPIMDDLTLVVADL